MLIFISSILYILKFTLHFRALEIVDLLFNKQFNARLERFVEMFKKNPKSEDIGQVQAIMEKSNLFVIVFQKSEHIHSFIDLLVVSNSYFIF